jgi:hypothetical protein
MQHPHMLDLPPLKIPIFIIKELKRGFKNYIPLALCTHKACQNATRFSDHVDTEIRWTEKGKMRLKQKSMNVSRTLGIIS